MTHDRMSIDTRTDIGVVRLRSSLAQKTRENAVINLSLLTCVSSPKSLSIRDKLLRLEQPTA